MDIQSNNILSVSQLNKRIADAIRLAPDLTSVVVRGEISNFKHHSTGHLYFSIKDDFSIIKCVCFSSYAQRLSFEPKDGMKVIISGKIDVYQQTGNYQIYVSNIVVDGIGDLYIAFEKLKQKLGQEGLFDPLHKKKLPKYPKTIGIVTSPTGAAIQDMLNILSRRYPISQLILYPALVQGNEAAKSIIHGIEYFNKHPVDVIIIGRGGGSLEDLFCFNDETLARVIYKSVIPIISAVGHEIDFTISDFVADLRAPTPSAAAELVVPNISDLIIELKNQNAHLASLLQSKINLYKSYLSRIQSSYFLSRPERIYEPFYQKVENQNKLLTDSFSKYLLGKKVSFEKVCDKLDSLNPLKVLSRGFSATFVKDKALTSINQVEIGEQTTIKLLDGTLTTTITDKKEELLWQMKKK